MASLRSRYSGSSAYRALAICQSRTCRRASPKRPMVHAMITRNIAFIVVLRKMRRPPRAQPISAKGEGRAASLTGDAPRNEVASSDVVQMSNRRGKKPAPACSPRTNGAEDAMLRSLAGAVALAIITLPAAAQNTNQGAPPNQGAPQATVPPGNSGAGIPGQQGNKSGPAAKGPSATTGAGSSGSGGDRAGQDASKVPGLPGGKSGPAAKSPSGAAPK
jgi:hypothetical protein